MPDIVTLGESMVLLVPDRAGLLRYADRFERYVAGAESNTAIGLVRLGHSAGWISRVGADEFGACVRSTIRGEGVDTQHVRQDPAAPTAVFFKERRRPDETRVYYYRNGSAASKLSPNDLPEAYITQAEYLHLTGITPALSSSCHETVGSALQIAREGGTRVSFDPNLRLKLWSEDRARETLDRIIPSVDILLAGEEEAAILTGVSDVERAARTLKDRGPDQVVIKQGSRGGTAVWGEAYNQIHHPAAEVTVVEEVGAGDAFNAGYLSGCLRGWTVEDSLHLATVMGALAVTAPGDVEGLPTWAEIQPYLDEESPSARR